MSVVPWGLDQEQQPSFSTTTRSQPGCASFFICAASSSSSTPRTAYRIRIQPPSNESSTACAVVRRYSELREMHSLLCVQGLVPVTSAARTLFPPKAPYSSAALAQQRAGKLQAWLECLLNEDNVAQSPLFWTLLKGGRTLVL